MRLHVFTRLVCLFHLGLLSLPFPSSLVKLTAAWSNFLYNSEPAKRLLLQICAKKSPAKKRRGRGARMLFCLIYFFAPFPYIAFRIIMSFRKLIPPFTLTVWPMVYRSTVLLMQVYTKLLKTESLDNAILAFWLAYPSWYMRRTMIPIYGQVYASNSGDFFFRER